MIAIGSSLLLLALLYVLMGFFCAAEAAFTSARCEASAASCSSFRPGSGYVVLTIVMGSPFSTMYFFTTS